MRCSPTASMHLTQRPALEFSMGVCARSPWDFSLHTPDSSEPTPATFFSVLSRPVSNVVARPLRSLNPSQHGGRLHPQPSCRWGRDSHFANQYPLASPPSERPSEHYSDTSDASTPPSCAFDSISQSSFSPICPKPQPFHTCHSLGYSDNSTSYPQHQPSESRGCPSSPPARPSCSPKSSPNAPRFTRSRHRCWSRPRCWSRHC
jgi:hypothetical protein